MNAAQITFFQVTAKNISERKLADMTLPEVLILAMDKVISDSGREVPSASVVNSDDAYKAAALLLKHLTREQFDNDLVRAATDLGLVFDPVAGGYSITLPFLEARRELSKNEPIKQPMLMLTITVLGKPYTSDQLESLSHLLVAYEFHQRHYDNDPEAKVTFGEEVFTQKDVHALLAEMMSNPLTKSLLKSFGYNNPRIDLDPFRGGGYDRAVTLSRDARRDRGDHPDLRGGDYDVRDGDYRGVPMGRVLGRGRSRG